MQGKEVFHVLLLIIASLIVIVNIYVLSLFIRNRGIRKNKSNILLISLAVADLLSGSVNIPFLVASEMAHSNRDPNYMEMIITADFATVACSAVTMLCMCNIVADRYLAICHPMTYASVVSRRRIFILIFFTWCFPLLVTLLRLWWIFPMLQGNTPSAIKNAVNSDHGYYITGCCLYFILIVLLLMIFMRMYIAIQRLGKHEERFVVINEASVSLKREIKAVILFAIMYFAFLFCWTPMVVLRLVSTTDIVIFYQIPHSVVHSMPIIRFLTSILNPLIYTFHKYDIYRAAAADFRNLSLKVNNRFQILCTGYVRARSPKLSRPKSRATEVSYATPNQEYNPDLNGLDFHLQRETIL